MSTVWTWPDLGKIRLRQQTLYDESYFNGQRKDGYADYRGSEAVLKKEFATTVNWLRKHGTAGGDLLEIGCAYGYFLQEAAKHFNVRGVEVATDAVEYCQSRGLQVADESLATVMASRAARMDVVVMLDVIEHLDDLPGTFAGLRDSIRPAESDVDHW